MIAYGHREKVPCSDAETFVTPGPAATTVLLKIEIAKAIKSKGKPPLMQAVRMSAESIKHLENATTVVPDTDRTEIYNADPCALATELERSGAYFTTHAAGFNLSKDDG